MKSIIALAFAIIASTGSAFAAKTIYVGTGNPKNPSDVDAMNYVFMDKAGKLKSAPEAIKAGEEITIKFINRSKSQGVTHNLVVTNPGKDKEIAEAGLSAGAAKNWTPDSPEILAKTKLLDAGQSEEIKVKFAAAGTYPIICTFPGHYPMMKSALTVK
jgi:azurin